MEKWRARFISPRPSLWWRGWWHDLARWPHHVLAPRTRLPRSARWLSIRGTRVRSCRNPRRLISWSFPYLSVLGGGPGGGEHAAHAMLQPYNGIGPAVIASYGRRLGGGDHGFPDRSRSIFL